MTRFGQAPSLALGVEEEFQIVDPETGALVDRVDHFLKKAPSSLAPYLRTETYQCTVELATPVCRDLDALDECLPRLRAQLCHLAADLGVGVVAAGTHPIGRWEEQSVTPGPRYEEIVEEVGWPAKREIVYGHHVHVSVPSGPAAATVVNGLRVALPVVLALSANAPFWRGRDTRLASARMVLVSALPRTGLPRRFEDWDDLQAALRRLVACNEVQKVNKVWWDVRPRPDLGSVEVRIADMPTTVRESRDLAALVQRLAARLLHLHETGRPAWDGPREVLEADRWQAIRHGPAARLMALAPEGTTTVDETLARLYERPAGEAGRDGDGALFQRLRRRAAHGTSGADRQREVYAATGDLRAVVRDLRRRSRPRA